MYVNRFELSQNSSQERSLFNFCHYLCLIIRLSFPDMISLLLVATHEIGHAIGLGHTLVNGSVMEAFYNPDMAQEVNLGPDDIAGVQGLYGKLIHYQR